CSLFYSVAWVF
nr:immunoglobulin light chain junction region [Macaca mulatta]